MTTPSHGQRLNNQISIEGMAGLSRSHLLPASVRLPDVSQFSAAKVLASWQRPTAGLRALATGADGAIDQEMLKRLEASRICVEGGHSVLLLSYESVYSVAGGLAQVALQLPAEFNRVMSGDPARPNPDIMRRLSPLHGKLKTALPTGAFVEARAKAASYLEGDESTRSYISSVLEADGRGDAALYHPAAVEIRTEQGDGIQAEVLFLGACDVPFGKADASGQRPQVKTDIFRVFDYASSSTWYLFGSDDFFGGDKSAYEYSYTPRGREAVPDQLMHDALFGSVAVAYIAAYLGVQSPIFHAQDWQFAPVALSAKEACLRGALPEAAVVLTLHNVYSQELSSGQLALISDLYQDHRWGGLGSDDSAKSVVRSTVHTRMIPLCDAPLSGVSADFVADIMNVPACIDQSPAIGDEIARHGMVGIANGTFVRASRDKIIEDAVRAARRGDTGQILQLKGARKLAMLTALAKYLEAQRVRDNEDGGTRVIGRFLEERVPQSGPRAALHSAPNDTPFIFTMGRFDPNQKGQCLLLEAVAKLPPSCPARLVVGCAGLTAKNFPMFLARAREVAEQSNGRLVVLTDFLTGDIRSHLQMGSDVMVIPSLYEPGGMPSEAYAALTPVIANATGGLRRLVKHFGPENPAGSGFHFGIPGAYEPAANTQWHQINGQYDPAERMKVPVYRGLVESLSSTIEHFVDFYRFNPDMYALMLSNLPSQLSNVSWVPSVVEYSKLFDVASSPQYRIASV